MIYKYPDNIPLFVKNKSAMIQKRVIESYNSAFHETASELQAQKAAISSLFNIEDMLKNQTTGFLTKSADEELRQVTYIAMLPDHTDLHGDYTSLEEVRKACISFNKSNQNANLFHVLMTDTFYVIESYCLPVDAEIDGVLIKKGTWLMTLQIESDKVWEMIKSKDINGISIGAMAMVEEIENPEGWDD